MAGASKEQVAEMFGGLSGGTTPGKKPEAKEPVPIDQVRVQQVPSMHSEFDAETGVYTLVVAEQMNPVVAQELVAAGGGEVELAADEAGVVVMRVTITGKTGTQRAADAEAVRAQAEKEGPGEPEQPTGQPLQPGGEPKPLTPGGTKPEDEDEEERKKKQPQKAGAGRR